jgi:hypothetical protein
LVGPTIYQGGVLVEVLISILWEGVDEGNKMDLLWELMKEIVWSCQVHDYASWWSYLG